MLESYAREKDKHFEIENVLKKYNNRKTTNDQKKKKFVDNLLDFELFV